VAFDGEERPVFGVKLDEQKRRALDAFEIAIKPVVEVLECWLLAGQADYLPRVIFRDTTDLERIRTDNYPAARMWCAFTLP
jgi:DNA-binding Lrp family transcriptional regulator